MERRSLLKPFAAVAAVALAATARADNFSGEQRFRALYKELIETNTTLSAGSCTLAAERMAARLKVAGFTDMDLYLFAAPGHPKEGGLVAIYPGRDPTLKGILLLAHLDVVEAKREDWTRDPFSLIEENGKFYARGTVDDKANAAADVDMLIRFREENYRPLRTVKVALTCGEETVGAFNGAQWLTQNKRDLIDAAFALNEGPGGEMDAAGHRVALDVEIGQKAVQNFRLEVTNPGGHSSVPVKDNAIYRLASALKKIEAYSFPSQLSDATRAYFAGMAKIQAARGEATATEDLNAMLRNPDDPEAIARVSDRDPYWSAILRTTCVATLLEAGHATNALPQRARANVNCRIFPGTTSEAVRAKLEELVADAEVKVTALEARGASVPPPPLKREIMAPVEKLAAQFWPGVPVLPLLLVGASDTMYLNAAGIPTYGIQPLFLRPDNGNVHGLNEYIDVQVLMECRDFLYRLVKTYAEQK
jgi:acetylornithine deacetylase/succinyl-diaminopimelate desuccinylase-like protein